MLNNCVPANEYIYPIQADVKKSKGSARQIAG